METMIIIIPALQFAIKYQSKHSNSLAIVNEDESVRLETAKSVHQNSVRKNNCIKDKLREKRERHLNAWNVTTKHGQ